MDPHFSTYFYTAESLANVKSIVLVADLDASDDLLLTLFKQAFDTVSASSPKNVTLTLTDLLVQLVDEVSAVPPDVVDVVLAQFLPKASKTRPAAFRLAVDVCLGAADKLQRGVGQYFAEVLTEELPESEEEEEEEDVKGKGKKTLGPVPSSVVSAHGLVASLSRAAPAVMMNVIPLLSQSLASSSAAVRGLTVGTLGGMFGEKPGQGDVAAKYPAVWRAWLGRARDKETLVRAGVADKLARIWKEHPELKADLEQVTMALLHDSEDKVRFTATAIFRELDYEVSTLHHSSPGPLLKPTPSALSQTAAHHVSLNGLEALAGRCRDRKSQVRELAFETLGRFFALAYPEIESKDLRALHQFGWIPSQLIDTLVLGDPSNGPHVRLLVRHTIQDHILPAPAKEDDEASWVDRFLLVYASLSAGERRTLLALSHVPEHRPGAFEYFLQACEQNNGGVIDGDAAKIKAGLKQTIRALAARLPEPAKVAEDLDKFAQANEKALYKLLRTMVDPQADQKTLAKTRQEIKKRTAKLGATLVETVMLVVRDHAYLLLNKSSIPPLLKRAQAGRDDPAAASALEVLDALARKKAVMFRSHVAELTKSLADSNAPDVTTAALHALSKLAKVDSEFHPDKSLSVKMVKFAKGDDPRQAKYAATVIALDENRQGTADDLVIELADDLAEASGAELVARLNALGRVARHAIKAFEPKSMEIATKALEVLFAPPTPEEEFDDPTVNFVDPEQAADSCLAREAALKVIVNRALAFADDDKEAHTAAGPVFNTLWPLSLYNDDPDASKFTVTTGSRLRLAAVNALLKLATHDRLHDEILRHFARLARVAHDPVYEVRAGLIVRLLGYLREGRARLPPRLNLLLFLTAHEPEEELRAETVSFVRRRVAQLPPAARQALWEHPFVRLLSLLAHHQQGTACVNEEATAETAGYISMYLDCIATRENLSYLYHLALKLKTVRDIESAAFDDTLYKLSELAQVLILRLGHDKGWPVNTHTLPVKMPGDIFRSLPDAQRAREVSERQYLSDELLKPFKPREKGEAKARAAGGAARVRVAKEKAPRSSPTPRKRTTSSGNGNGNGSARRAKKSKKNTSGYYSEDEVRGTTSEEDGEGDSGEDSEGERPAARVGARGGLRSGPAVTSEAEEEEEEEEKAAEEMDVDEDEEAPEPKGKVKEKAKAAPASASKGKAKAAPASNGSARKGRTGGARAEAGVEASSPAPREGRASRSRA